MYSQAIKVRKLTLKKLEPNNNEPNTNASKKKVHVKVKTNVSYISINKTGILEG